MRWQPTTPTCGECGFSWSVPLTAAIGVVAACPGQLAGQLPPGRPVREPPAGTWSVGAYLWHLVDVFRIGTERLWTIQLDPAAGIPCWDENALADVRRYASLSPAVGLRALSVAVHSWCDAAGQARPEARTEHPEFGSVTAADVIRRNAHEARHHLLDIERQLR